jgi:hypothetical protein
VASVVGEEEGREWVGSGCGAGWLVRGGGGGGCVVGWLVKRKRDWRVGVE